jgi:hypothetical protein
MVGKDARHGDLREPGRTDIEAKEEEEEEVVRMNAKH